jgi:small GTP-binding protein
MEQTEKPILKSIILSEFGNEGPNPIVYWPNTLERRAGLLISMKTISLLMGDSIYQDSYEVDGVNYFGVIPFPDLKLTGLTYFFLIPDPEARGNAKAATITILVDQENKHFLYENMKYLRVIIDRTATKIQETLDKIKYQDYIQALKEELNEFTSEIEDPFSVKRKIKIVFVGLDKAGKTSFLYGVKKRYSEIIKSMPTKGVSRSEEELISQKNSEIMIWDFGGQEKYLNKYFEQSKLYLYNVDLLFFFIDIQAPERFDESLALFRKIISSLTEFDEFPPIVVCLNKYDPDLQNSKETKQHYRYLSEKIRDLSDKFFVKIFKTSVFTQWSLMTAYSFGLGQLSPNRELFRQQLKNFANKTSTDALLLLNENGIIISNYSRDEISEKVFEISAPHFQTLYKTFKEFKLLKKDFIVSSGVMNDSKKLVYKRIKVSKYNLYLLLFLEEETSIDRIEKNLPDLSDNLIELVNTYI